MGKWSASRVPRPLSWATVARSSNIGLEDTTLPGQSIVTGGLRSRTISVVVHSGVANFEH